MSLPARLARLGSLQREFLGLAQVMVGLLERGELEALEDAWAKRERLFPQLAQGHRELEPWLADWSASLAGLPADQAREAQAAMDDLAGRGRLILDLDQRAKAMLQAELTRLGADLANLGRGQRLSRAYRAEQAPPCPTQVSRMG